MQSGTKNKKKKRKLNHMHKFPVEIKSLPTMKVASVRAISQTPENDAKAILDKYIKKHNLMDDPESHPIFGFNNPDPTPGHKEYGYEFWIKIDSIAETEADVIIKEIPSALYVVKECNLFDESNSEFFKAHGFLESWSQLSQWVKESDYQEGSHQGLEKALNHGAEFEDLQLELYMPIIKGKNGVGN